MSEREHFLKEIWSPYPAADANWIDVATFAAGPTAKALVCGRISLLQPHQLQLSSFGQTLSFDFASEVAWLRPQKQVVRFRPELLSDGDQVCLKLVKSVVVAVLLLTPFRADFRLKTKFNARTSENWTQFTSAIRAFFRDRKFTEAFTPTLVPSPGTEPYLDAFSTEWALGTKTRTLFLPTSPEFHLKKMLAAGWTRLFEIKNCFRNGEISPHHEPEFHMLEWYRAYANLDAIADDVEQLIAETAKILRPHAASPKLKRTTMAQLFTEAFPGFSLSAKTTRDELLQLAQREGIQTSRSDSFDDIFFRLFLERIETHLGADGPLLVQGYPPSQAALSRLGPDGFADRFEVYWKGLELANAFHELNDPEENENRFRDDLKRKIEIGKTEVPIDEELIQALYHGLPPSGGIALGLERLFMALFEVETISETRAFSAGAE